MLVFFGLVQVWLGAHSAKRAIERGDPWWVGGCIATISLLIAVLAVELIERFA